VQFQQEETGNSASGRGEEAANVIKEECRGKKLSELLLYLDTQFRASFKLYLGYSIAPAAFAAPERGLFGSGRGVDPLDEEAESCRRCASARESGWC
jgi:hypothetical protein